MTDKQHILDKISKIADELGLSEKKMTIQEAQKQAEQIIDDHQMTLHPGEIMHTEYLFETVCSMLQPDKFFNPMVAAALTVSLCQRLNLVKQSKEQE